MEKPIRVLHVVTIMDLGGIETFLMTLYRKINKNNVQFDFLVHRKEKGFFDDEIRSLGGKLLYIRPLDPMSYFQYKREFNKLISENNYSIIHSHLNANSSIVLNLAKKLGIETRVAHSHIDKTTKGIKGLLKSVSKIFINKVSTYKFACSAQAGRWLFGQKAKFRVLTNAIESVNFVFTPQKRLALRNRMGIADHDIVIGNIARFNTQKNHGFIIDVFDVFLKRNPRGKLLLLGEGELKERIERRVADMKLTQAVIFTGAVGNANEYLNAMDVFLFPSLFEGLGIVAIEAQTNGLPVILNGNLPNELDITDLVFRLSLEDTTEKWVSTLEESLERNGKRRSRQEEVIEQGYDVSDNVQFLERFYIEQGNRII